MFQRMEIKTEDEALIEPLGTIYTLKIMDRDSKKCDLFIFYFTSKEKFLYFRKFLFRNAAMDESVVLDGCVNYF